MSPQFSELAKVRVNFAVHGEYEGYVVAMEFRKGRWIYKVSLLNPDTPDQCFDNWYQESDLEKVP
jgi:hypothetical protein